jgi:hypothetical protein
MLQQLISCALVSMLLFHQRADFSDQVRELAFDDVPDNTVIQLSLCMNKNVTEGDDSPRI